MAAKNCLIIGQGLAGSILSFELYRRGIPHKLVDDHHNSAATKAAAGIVNPITGRRYVKSWMIEDLIPVAQNTYSELESLLGLALITKANIIRALDNLSQENQWNEATSRVGYKDYLAPVDLENYDKIVQTRFSYGTISQSFQVDVSSFISGYRDFLIQKEMLITKRFDYSELNYESSEYTYEGHTFDSIIFCDGYKSTTNPLFSNLPFQPAKGESFEVKIKEQLPSQLLRDKIYIAPLSAHSFWTGGGYQWDELDEQPTVAFRAQWQEKLNELLITDFEIVKHKAGVRPSVKGRRPLIGQHHQNKNVYLFNGFGTKGTSLAPYWAKSFVELLLNGQAISDEVDLNRFVTNQ